MTGRPRRPQTPMERQEEESRRRREEAAAGTAAILEDLQKAAASVGQEDFLPATLELAPPAGNPPVYGRRLDWTSKHDERSRAYALADRLRQRVALQDHLWPTGPVLDQGNEGACVGFATAAAGNVLELVALPGQAGELAELEDAADALAIYHRAQELDDISGEAYAGTSVLAGMKAGVERGLFAGYGWCFGTRDLAQAVLQVGPVVVGIPWTEGMYATPPNGRVMVTGATVGGHCLAVVGLRMALEYPRLMDPAGPYFVVQNSWGESYGDGGLGYVHHADMARLLAQQGEAAIPLETGWEPAS